MRRTMAFNVFFATTVMCLTALSLSVEALKLTQLNEHCLGCICEAVGGQCSPNTKCTGEVCGMFGITRAYWSDSGKPVVEGSNPHDPDAYSKCATNAECANKSVMSYMKKFARDCNEDGQINCYDYAIIHMLGRYGCKASLPDEYNARFLACQFTIRDLLG